MPGSTDEVRSRSAAVSHSTDHAGVARPDLSVVIPVYNEEGNIAVLYSRLTAVLEQTGLAYEMIFVDDGSRDKSLALLHALVVQYHHGTVVELARNFGHQVAITAGLDHARGNAVIVMDSDLQDRPELLLLVIVKWKEGCVGG